MNKVSVYKTKGEFNDQKLFLKYRFQKGLLLFYKFVIIEF